MTTTAERASEPGLIVIPRRREDVATLVEDAHGLGIPPEGVLVLGAVDQRAAEALARHHDAPPGATSQAMARLLALLDPSDRYELLGATLGALAGVLGGFIALALPGSGMVWFAGGAQLLLAEEAAGGYAGLGLGGLIGAWLGLRVREDAEARYRQALQDGHVIVALRGPHEAVQLVERRLHAFEVAATEKFAGSPQDP